MITRLTQAETASTLLLLSLEDADMQTSFAEHVYRSIILKLSAANKKHYDRPRLLLPRNALKPSSAKSEMPWNKGVAVLLATTTISKLDAQWRTHMVNNSEAQSPEFGVTSPAQSSNSSEQ
ncbi:hypothetical protein WJX77_005600 [Trebouxia sp. C0004]